LIFFGKFLGSGTRRPARILILAGSVTGKLCFERVSGFFFFLHFSLAGTIGRLHVELL